MLKQAPDADVGPAAVGLAELIPALALALALDEASDVHALAPVLADEEEEEKEPLAGVAQTLASESCVGPICDRKYAKYVR